jgi:hypothetical protein
MKSKKRTPYTRLACFHCKEKHQKCDGSKPACKNCIRKNLECSYRPERNSLTKKRDEIPTQDDMEYLMHKLNVWKKRYSELKTWVESKLNQPIPSNLHNYEYENPETINHNINGTSSLKRKRTPEPPLESTLPSLTQFSSFIPQDNYSQTRISVFKQVIPENSPTPSNFNSHNSSSSISHNGSNINLPRLSTMISPHTGVNALLNDVNVDYTHSRYDFMVTPRIPDIKPEPDITQPLVELSAFRGIGASKYWPSDPLNSSKTNSSVSNLLLPDIHSKLVPVLLVQKSGNT